MKTNEKLFSGVKKTNTANTNSEKKGNDFKWHIRNVFKCIPKEYIRNDIEMLLKGEWLLNGWDLCLVEYPDIRLSYPDRDTN